MKFTCSSIVLSALLLTACSSSQQEQPKQKAELSAEGRAVIQAVHEPLDKAKAVDGLVQESALQQKSQIDNQQ